LRALERLRREELAVLRAELEEFIMGRERRRE
jgi:hypothetical protein